MNPTTPLIEKKTVDKLFHIGMLIKAGAAIFEIGTGILAFFLTTNEVLHVTQLLVQGKLAVDPDNLLANYILDLGFSFTPGQTNWFLFIYLAGHGVVNMFLVISLLKKKMWAYPLSLLIFGAFVAYEAWQVFFTHSPFLAAFTIFDLAVIWLIWKEYRYMRRKHSHTA
jgi:uncharacterized membrane protein